MKENKEQRFMKEKKQKRKGPDGHRPVRKRRLGRHHVFRMTHRRGEFCVCIPPTIEFAGMV
jgi:hypothetical protein